MMYVKTWETTVDDVSDILDSMLNGEYDNDDVCFESLVCELSDNSVPIYNYDLYNNIPEIIDFADQVLQEMRFNCLDDVLKMAYYERTREGLFDNFQNLIYNLTVEELNKQCKECEDDEIESYFFDLDFNKSIPEIKELIKIFVEGIK